MSEDPLRQHRPDYARHDLFLHALLGALHRAEQLEIRLAHLPAAEAGSASPRGPVEEPTALILGCAALARTLHERVLASCPPHEPPPTPDHAAWDRSLLR